MIFIRAVVVVSNVDKKVILQEIVHQVADQVVEVDVMEVVIVTEDVMVDVIVIAVETVVVIVTEEDQDQDHKYLNFELIRFIVFIKCILYN